MIVLSKSLPPLLPLCLGPPDTLKQPSMQPACQYALQSFRNEVFGVLGPTLTQLDWLAATTMDKKCLWPLAGRVPSEIPYLLTVNMRWEEAPAKTSFTIRHCQPTWFTCGLYDCVTIADYCRLAAFILRLFKLHGVDINTHIVAKVCMLYWTKCFAYIAYKQFSWNTRTGVQTEYSRRKPTRWWI